MFAVDDVDIYYRRCAGEEMVFLWERAFGKDRIMGARIIFRDNIMKAIRRDEIKLMLAKWRLIFLGLLKIYGKIYI